MSLAVPSANASDGGGPDPLRFLLTGRRVVVPTEVRAELREIASYDDPTGAAAGDVLAAAAYYDVQEPDDRPSFGVGPGETDAVVLADAVGVDL